jgi:hypothetical protein
LVAVDVFQVADVVAMSSCTPPPDLQGGITSGDERVQIYVPSPQAVFDSHYCRISIHR